MNPKKILIIIACLLFMPWYYCQAQDVNWHPGHYVILEEEYLEADKDPAVALRLERFIASLPKEITGIKGGAYWYMLESSKGSYDFGVIQKQLEVCKRYGKRFFCSIYEKRFNSLRNPGPGYLIADPVFDGGVIPFAKHAGMGSTAKLWHPEVLKRFNALIVALGERFDNQPYFEGIEFSETAYPGEFDQAPPPKQYIDAYYSRLQTAKKAFPHCVVLQQVNFIPGDMRDFFDYCYLIGVGIGGPDLVPDQGRNPARRRIPAYAFFPVYAGKMPLASNVESPEYMTTLKSGASFGNFTPQSIYTMGVDTLKLNYIFWFPCEWKSANFTFFRDVIPYLEKIQWKINTDYPSNLKPARKGLEYD